MNRIIRFFLPILVMACLFLLSACEEKTPDTRPTAAAAQTTETTVPTRPTETTPTEPQEERFLLTFAGDCTFGSTQANAFALYGFPKTVGEDYRYPFANVISWFENDDFTMVNLEGPLCDSGNPVQKKHTFRGSTSYVHILTENSVEAVTLANNHSLDYGQFGYDCTTATLQAAGVPYVEENSSTIVATEGGLTIGLYAAVYYSLDMEDMISEITALKERGADVIIFAPHWGAELYYGPNEIQKEFGYAAIDAGANIVFGSHPHVLQPVEEYNGGVIYYSLGNFSFGGNIYPGDYDTALIRQEVIRGSDGTIRLGELTAVPCNVSSAADHNNFQPTPYAAESGDYARVMEKLGLVP